MYLARLVACCRSLVAPLVTCHRRLGSVQVSVGEDDLHKSVPQSLMSTRTLCLGFTWSGPKMSSSATRPPMHTSSLASIWRRETEVSSCHSTRVLEKSCQPAPRIPAVRMRRLWFAFDRVTRQPQRLFLKKPPKPRQGSLSTRGRRFVLRSKFTQTVCTHNSQNCWEVVRALQQVSAL